MTDDHFFAFSMRGGCLIWTHEMDTFLNIAPFQFFFTACN